MVEPFNITRLKTREQAAYQAAVDARDASLLRTQASWFEAQALKKSNPRQAERERETMMEDLRIAAEQLTKVRRARLHELYKAEFADWQRELAMRGLTVEVDRDM